MPNIERSSVSHILEGLAEGLAANIRPENLSAAVSSLLAMESLYQSAAREVSTKLENLNDEFRCTKARNPIHHIVTRVKSPKSTIAKLVRRGFPVSFESARENITDIAGVRVICSYIDDIYLLARLLVSQDDIELIRTTDYIKSPKPNGYRSLHLIVTVPVFLSNRTERVKVEIQIRTIAMDFWASLEHELAYKTAERGDVARELRDCADVIAQTDQRMQALHDTLATADAAEEGSGGSTRGAEGGQTALGGEESRGGASAKAS